MFESIDFKRRELLTNASDKLDESARILTELAKEYVFSAAQTKSPLQEEKAIRAYKDVMKTVESIGNISNMLKDARTKTL